jgi:HEAT repeat protein
MRNSLICGILGSLVLLGGIARGDDRADVAKHVMILKTSKSNDARVSAVSDLLLISSSNFAAIFPAIPDLIDVLKNDKNHQVRATAALVLYNTGAEAKQAIPVCIALLKDDKEHADVKYGVAMIAGVCGGNGVKEAKEALPILMQIEKAEKDKDASKRNERLLEGVATAIGSIQAGTKGK